MSYIATPLPPSEPPPPEIPAFVRGGASIITEGAPRFSQGYSFTTDKPFTVEDYALGRGLTIEVAQLVLDQAVADGDVVVV